MLLEPAHLASEPAGVGAEKLATGEPDGDSMPSGSVGLSQAVKREREAKAARSRGPPVT